MKTTRKRTSCCDIWSVSLLCLKWLFASASVGGFVWSVVSAGRTEQEQDSAEATTKVTQRDRVSQRGCTRPEVGVIITFTNLLGKSRPKPGRHWSFEARFYVSLTKATKKRPGRVSQLGNKLVSTLQLHIQCIVNYQRMQIYLCPHPQTNNVVIFTKMELLQRHPAALQLAAVYDFISSVLHTTTEWDWFNKETRAERVLHTENCYQRAEISFTISNTTFLSDYYSLCIRFLTIVLPK